jgi:hypothetical protein
LYILNSMEVDPFEKVLKNLNESGIEA